MGDSSDEGEGEGEKGEAVVDRYGFVHHDR
jgi:hypothetical protein